MPHDANAVRHEVTPDNGVSCGTAGVYVSRALADGTYEAPRMVIANYASGAGGWRVDQHPRFLSDINGDGRADVVGFGNAGVYV